MVGLNNILNTARSRLNVGVVTGSIGSMKHTHKQSKRQRAKEMMFHEQELLALRLLSKSIHNLAREKGWWNDENGEPVKSRNVGESLMLIVSELAEGFNDWRQHKGVDDHVPEYTPLEVELADAIIRILDFAEGHGLDVPGALIAKHIYNRSRPYRHGDKKC